MYFDASLICGRRGVHVWCAWALTGASASDNTSQDANASENLTVGDSFMNASCGTTSRAAFSPVPLVLSGASYCTVYIIMYTCSPCLTIPAIKTRECPQTYKCRIIKLDFDQIILKMIHVHSIATYMYLAPFGETFFHYCN